jgi:two-component system response regulator YesN
MYNVMVVDDSMPLVRNIKRHIETADSRLKVTHVAYNGQQALSVLEEKNIDIVFSDIRMPKMDGLSFLEEARKRNPHTKFFILTGFNDFEYARRAIKLDIQEYMLKPLDPKELVPALKQTIDELDRERRRWQENAVSRLLSGGGMDNDTVVIPPLQAAGCYLAVLRNGWLKGGSTIDRSRIDLSCRLAVFDASWIAADTSADNEKAVLLGTEADPASVKECMHRLFNHLRAEYPALSMVYCKLEPSRELIQPGYLFLSTVLDKSVIIGQAQLVEANVSEASTEWTKTEEIAVIKCQTVLRHARKLHLTEELQKLFAYWKTDSTPVHRVRSVLHAIAEPIGKQFHSSEIDAMFADCTSSDVLKDRFSGRLLDLVDRFKTSIPMSRATMELIDDYLSRHLHRNIRMKEVCRELNYSATYVIRIVKKYRGMTPVEYINKLKTDEAKAMMDSGGTIMIKDIAEALGFNDQHYFCKVFKQYTGVSPSEYRTRNV